MSSKQLLVQRIAEAIVEWQNAVQAFDEAAAARLGVKLVDQRCLSYLATQGEMSPGRLAQVSGLTSGAVTAAIDRWERAGLARRKRNTEDRRGVLVELTPAAKELIAEMWGPLAKAGSAMLLGYSDRELQIIDSFLRKCIEVQAGQAAHLGRGRAKSDGPIR